MRKVIVALLAVFSIALGGLFYWMCQQDDTVPPVISFPEGTIMYIEGEDTELLLDGVKAYDEVDGDVSGTLVVDSVIPLQDQTKATVLYYAKDKSNNVAKARRSVEYRPAEGIFWLDETESETEEPAETETETGTESERETEPELLADGSPRIWLTTNAVTVQDGESYNLLSYVKDIKDDIDGPDWLYGQIHIEGMYDISGPGVYELIYSVVDREGNMSNGAKLKLTIQ